MIISFFGHKSFGDTSIKIADVVKQIEEIAGGQVVHFYMGAYGSFDTFGKECAKEYKKAHPDTLIILITPYIHPNYCLLDGAKERYDEIIYPELENVPPRYAISKRNEWIVEQSDFIFFYVRSSFGGAYNALIHAKRKKIKHKNLYIKQTTFFDREYFNDFEE